MPKRAKTTNETAAALLRGEPAIFPTETVYGLGVAVGAADSPETLYDIKERDHGKPISWLIADQGDLDRYGKVVPDFARALARTFWPGPLTLIVRAGDAVPPAFRSAEGTIGLRMPDNDCALGLIRAVGKPLATTSANRSGGKAPHSFEALDPLLTARVATMLKDADDKDKSGVASTVIDCTAEHPVMVREGAISISDIQALS